MLLGMGMAEAILFVKESQLNESLLRVELFILWLELMNHHLGRGCAQHLINIKHTFPSNLKSGIIQSIERLITQTLMEYFRASESTILYSGERNRELWRALDVVDEKSYITIMVYKMRRDV
ncbi:hypothetical protein E2C01_015626 [Portunus trituberculatus]|uniref:Uncharacterized protein n=1 Tax=Portunus trituberculatus TaxID=210409 RepID=A0A5B7DNG4_PORTR|nr:hypothetical protein [Portunus trituberculatus]